MDLLDKDGNVIDPSQGGSAVAYLIVNLCRSIGLEAKGKINVRAGGKHCPRSDKDIHIDTIESTSRKEMRIKSAGGINSVAGAGNIIGGNRS